VASSGSARPTPTEQRRTEPGQPEVPATPGTARVIAIANQKGGVGKSTTAVSLGAALAELGYRVLVVDLDPQGNASTGLGIRHEARDVTVYDVIVAEAPLDDAVVPTPLPNLYALPSTIDLAGAEIELVSQFSREGRLKRALEPVREGTYDYILLDCPPSLGLLTINALTAAEELIVPIQCEYYALEGLGQLLRNVNLVQQNINPGLRVTGIVLTMFDPRTKLSEQVVDEVRRFFGDLVYDVIIPRTVRLSEAPGFGQPITVYDPKSKGAQTYRQLAREVAVRPAPTTPMPEYDELPTVVVPPVDATATPAPTVPEELPDDDATDAAASDAVDSSTAQTSPPGPATAPAANPEPEGTPEDLEVSAAAAEAAAPVAPVEPVEAAPLAVEPVEPPPAEAPSAPDTAPRTEVPAPVSTPPPASTPPLADTASSRPLVPSEDEEIWEEADRAPEAKVRAPSGPVQPGHLPERRVVVIDEQAEAALTTTPTPVPPQGHAEPPETPDEASRSIGATLDDERPGGRKRRWRLFRKGG
jgi:chromosome partitioning protein